MKILRIGATVQHESSSDQLNRYQKLPWWQPTFLFFIYLFLTGDGTWRKRTTCMYFRPETGVVFEIVKNNFYFIIITNNSWHCINFLIVTRYILLLYENVEIIINWHCWYNFAITKDVRAPGLRWYLISHFVVSRCYSLYSETVNNVFTFSTHTIYWKNLGLTNL